MPIERASGGSSLVDVLDRVLDKGIVIDAWVRVSLVGIDLITVEARVVVASIDTYLKYARVGECLAAVTAWPGPHSKSGQDTQTDLHSGLTNCPWGRLPHRRHASSLRRPSWNCLKPCSAPTMWWGV